MKILTIFRLPRNPQATFGAMVAEDNIPRWLTLERTWHNNERGISCIPAGEYIMQRTIYHKHGYETFEVICPPRERVLFHTGNIDDDSHGCILVGEQFEPVLNKKNGVIENGILASGPGFKQFMKYLGEDKEVRLVIKEV